MHTPDAITGPLNLGNPHEMSILNLAKLTLELTESPSRIVHRSSPEDDPRQRQPDISRARKLLDWAPQTPLKEGLARAISYFRRLLAEPGMRAFVMGSTVSDENC